MINRHLENSLNNFGKKLVNLSKGRLQKAGKGGGNLENSIRYNIRNIEGNYDINFTMANYGKFVDKGVSGAGGEIKSGKHKGEYSGTNIYKDYQSKWKNSPYRFGSARSGGSIYKGIGSFIRKKNLQPRNEKEQYQTTLGLKIAMVKVLWTKGIKGISFFQNALRVTYKSFTDDLLTSYKEDLIEAINKEIT